jgi:hypothetical protein
MLTKQGGCSHGKRTFLFWEFRKRPINSEGEFMMNNQYFVPSAEYGYGNYPATATPVSGLPQTDDERAFPFWGAPFFGGGFHRPFFRPWFRPWFGGFGGFGGFPGHGFGGFPGYGGFGGFGGPGGFGGFPGYW